MNIGSRGCRLLLDLVLGGCIWVYLVMIHSDPSNPNKTKILKTVPGTLLIYFGCYSLYSIGHGLFILNDCPEEYNSLKQDIERAKTNLIKKGIKL